jgi:signal transduction histidine kinase
MNYTAQSADLGQKITQIILTHSDPQTLLERVAQALGEFFQVDTCLIVAFAQPGAQRSAHAVKTTQIAFWGTDESSPMALTDQEPRWLHRILQADWESHPVLAIEDIQLLEESWTAESTSQALPRALLAMPSQFQSSVNGIIVLGRSLPHAWTPQEKELLSLAVSMVAVALAQVQFTHSAHRLKHFQSLLTRLSLVIGDALNLDEILQMAIASTASALQMGRGLILLLSHTNLAHTEQADKSYAKTKVKVASEWLADAISSSPSAPNVPDGLNQSFLLSESGLCQRAFQQAPAPIIISDTLNASALDPKAEPLSIFEQDRMPALLIVPLLAPPSQAPSSPKILGFLVLQHYQPRWWDTDELQFVQGISAQVSAAILHHQTLQQVQSMLEERTAQLEHSLDVQAKLYETTRQNLVQLQQLNQLKDEFMSTMSHELRTPLTTMSLAIRMLRQPTLPPERHQKYLEILNQECNKEIELINDLLSLQRLEADRNAIQPQTMDLMLLIARVAESFEQKWADKPLTLVIDTPAEYLMLNTDADSLSRILQELLTNAGKYSDADTTVRLQVTQQTEAWGTQVILTLTNIGIGILPEDIDHIFDKFRRGQGVTQQAIPGTGLGLALVKCLVQHLNGAIEVSSEPLDNSQSYLTCFTLTLPQLQQ